MNTATIKSNWNITKGKLKQKYAQLTDDDLRYEEGKEQELLGRLQKKTGRTREEIESFLRTECDCDFASGSPSSSARPWENSTPSSTPGRTQSSARGQQQSSARKPNPGSTTPTSE